MYKLTGNGVFNKETNEYIPNNPGLSQWQEYQEWLNEGNSPEPLETLEEKRKRRKKEITNQVMNKINSMMSFEGDLYELALAIYLVDKKPQGLSSEESSVLDNLRNKFIQIEGYRDKEKQAYAEIDASDNPDLITIVLE